MSELPKSITKEQEEKRLKDFKAMQKIGTNFQIGHRVRLME